MKYWFGKLHLWLGLPLGSLFLVISLSGALYCWEPEFAAIAYRENVEPQEKPFVGIPVLKKSVEAALPDADFRTVYYRGPSKAVQLLLYAPGTYYHANLNPYTGELIHLQDMKKGWLNNLKFLHRNLMLGDIGREIVHWGTLLYLLMIISGIVLWWPARRSQRKQRFTIKWSASRKRLNYDLHNVLGFYSSWVLIFLVMTGLFWGFKIIKSSVKGFTQEDRIKYDVPRSAVDTTQADLAQYQIMDQLGEHFRKEFPDNNIRISNPHASDDPVQVSVIDKNRTVTNVDQYYFDRYTGARLSGSFQHGLHQDASLFTTLNGLAYDIHLGNIFGLPTRLLAFLASLIGASLSITGFVYWWGNRK
ncbi:PepSY-associated TM helix domain-containing protein [Persicitalea jodogahamensis]|uniref:Membrane protein n=1 Tax=Persicitalea jodogahamensis TaxID=402147 RepID=A0A8J3GCF4_9BACT|nr:PepSY-associated TM helix domain-containing protein [Persicitalea jodogahamensis]GHB84292.1 membrane protein [Persicitalea jodogahamensis]